MDKIQDLMKKVAKLDEHSYNVLPVYSNDTELGFDNEETSSESSFEQNDTEPDSDDDDDDDDDDVLLEKKKLLALHTKLTTLNIVFDTLNKWIAPVIQLSPVSKEAPLQDAMILKNIKITTYKNTHPCPCSLYMRMGKTITEIALIDLATKMYTDGDSSSIAYMNKRASPLNTRVSDEWWQQWLSANKIVMPDGQICLPYEKSVDSLFKGLSIIRGYAHMSNEHLLDFEKNCIVYPLEFMVALHSGRTPNSNPTREAPDLGIQKPAPNVELEATFVFV